MLCRYSLQFFTNFPAPFSTSLQPPPSKKSHQYQPVSDLEIVKCCYNFLSSDLNFYKNKWNWSQLLNAYFKKGCNLQQLYCNNILAKLTNMSQYQLKELNKNIPEELIVHTTMELLNHSSEHGTERQNTLDTDDKKTIQWNFSSDLVTNVQGVFLTIFDVANYQYYQSTDGFYDKTVMVESTKINLRSLALGVAFGKAICLSGPVGCGKSTLVDYLARKTGRVAIKDTKFTGKENLSSNIVVAEQTNGSLSKKSKKNKRSADDFENDIDENGSLYMSDDATRNKNGFLRIQLGDQTDSKMLLGQYRCTDVPGEFVWQPGVLTQVIIN